MCPDHLCIIVLVFAVLIVFMSCYCGCSACRSPFRLFLASVLLLRFLFLLLSSVVIVVLVVVVLLSLLPLLWLQLLRLPSEKLLLRLSLVYTKLALLAVISYRRLVSRRAYEANTSSKKRPARSASSHSTSSNNM